MAKSKEPLFDPIHLITDEPIDDLDNDNLGLMPWAKMIAGAAVGTRGPFTIGVHGQWGYGKSTLLKLSKKLIEKYYEEHEDENVVTVWFNAWQFEREKHPLFPLIAAITDEIEKKAKENVKFEGLRKIGDSLRALTHGMKFSGEAGLPLIGKVGVEFDAEKALKAEELIVKQTNPLQGEMIYHSAFSTLAKITKEEVKTKIVVFVDDLDHCNPDKAVFLLESIKLILAQPGFVFTLAVDRQVIESYLEKRYIRYCGENESNLGRFYMEKIIQLPIYIPSHRSRFGNYVQRLIDDLSEKHKESEHIKTLQSVQNIIAVGAGTNPRSLIRLINNFILDCILWPHIPRDGSKYKDFQNLSNDVAAALVFNRILHQLLSEDYKLLVYDQELCSTILEKDQKAYLRATDSDPTSNVQKSEEHSLSNRIAKKLQSEPEVLETLQSFGNVWLENQDLRIAVYEFAQTQRADSNISDLPEALARAIRRMLELRPDEPIAVDHIAEIRRLYLESEDTTDVDIAHLKQLQQLRELKLSSTKITDAGIVHLKNLQQLQSLSLSSTQITGAGLVHLKDLQHLQILDLNGRNITDEVIMHLKELQQLRTLYLMGIQITDAGIVHLKQLQHLQELYMYFTEITDAGMEDLRKALPNTEIFF